MKPLLTSLKKHPVRIAVALLFALASLRLVTALADSGETRPRPGMVAFYEGGYVDRISPNNEQYGGINSGMYGMFPEYCELLGHHCKYLNGHLTRDMLKGVDVLFIINPQTNWSRVDLDAIWHQVAEGHGLVVLGDHTDVVGTQQSLNDLLRPVSISFNFDAGLFFKHEWKNCMWILSNPVTRHLDSPNSHRISIGATLKCEGVARPVIVGKYGFSDWGNRWNAAGAYLGDYRYNANENIGNVPLVAEAEYGKGRVLVFGDTSPFQNFELPWNCLDFFSDCIAYTADPPTLSRRLGGGTDMVLILSTAGLVLWRRGRLPNVFAGLVALGMLAAHQPERNHLAGTNISGKKIAIVDVGCNPRINSGHGDDRSIDGLFSSLARNNYLPLNLPSPRPDEVTNASLLVYMAPEKEVPSQPPGRAALVFASPAERPGIRPLLEEYNLDITGVPLGFATDAGLTKKEGPTYKNAYAIGYLRDTGTNDTGIRYEILGDFKGLPTAVLAENGAHRLCLVADDGFAVDQNLEGIFTAHTNNIQFMNRILNKLQ